MPRTPRTAPPFRWQHTSTDAAPASPGCYAVLARGRVLYLGSAVNIRKRLQDHGLGCRWSRRRCPWGELSSIELRTCGSRRFGDWLAREARLIRRLRPPGNSKHARTREPGRCHTAREISRPVTHGDPT